MRTKIARMATPIVAATVLGAGVAALPAAAADTAGAKPRLIRIYNSGSGRCLYDSGRPSGGTFAGSCRRGNRYWRGVADVGGGRIINNRTRRCLTAGSTSAWSARCNGSASQVWKGVGFGLIQNSGRGTCLQGTTAGAGIMMRSCDQGNKYQQWGQLG
ncbi:RICIN domain-containing protein [Nonomuraea basaltis]|uniref:RICIN domain-containing protein n=1 Tax=Nonomuraea basaltis TaxID=2495887 RepID=UPI00110C5241|nr:ricin-type beta-trefoil lectin domain protein [Nonomuraea basaltis]TMR88360.1 hypothetical protein EJK15_66700 [Nonomuraea basaltis]